jgi:hypothetical protein
MVASNGILIFKTKPAVLGHAPIGVATDTYDFDGKKARIYKVKIQAYRTASTSHFVTLTVPGTNPIYIAGIGGQTAANAGIDGELLTDEINMCLDVPAGTVISWNHAASFMFFLLVYELMEG